MTTEKINHSNLIKLGFECSTFDTKDDLYTLKPIRLIRDKNTNEYKVYFKTCVVIQNAVFIRDLKRVYYGLTDVKL
jgi:hypothetical protein